MSACIVVGFHSGFWTLIVDLAVSDWPLCELVDQIGSRLVLTFERLNIRSTGIWPVDVCGAELYARRKFWISFWTRLFKTVAILVCLVRFLMTFFAFPLAWGHAGVDFLCSIPKWFKCWRNFSPLIGGPLLVIIGLGLPKSVQAWARADYEIYVKLWLA